VAKFGGDDRPSHLGNDAAKKDPNDSGKTEWPTTSAAINSYIITENSRLDTSNQITEK